MTRTTHLLLALLLGLVYLRSEGVASADTTDLWPRLAQGGVAVLIRPVRVDTAGRWIFSPDMIMMLLSSSSC